MRNISQNCVPYGGLSKLNEAICWALKESGITIAFPQLDVHLDERVENALESFSTGTGT